MLEQYRQAVDKHRQRVYSFAHYSLRAVEDAEDVTQEVFIKLWRNWQQIDHNKLPAWLMRVTHNAVIDHVRKRKRHTDVLDQFQDVEAQGDGQGTEQDSGESGRSVTSEGIMGGTMQDGTRLNQLDKERFRECLQQAIKALHDPFRSIIIMRDIQGQSYADIGQCLELSPSQTKVYLHRARRKLRDNPELKALCMSIFPEIGTGSTNSTSTNDTDASKGNSGGRNYGNQQRIAMSFHPVADR
ncbi:MAG: RNA polymerase sigma factor [Pseudohongiellaceae bacterium]